MQKKQRKRIQHGVKFNVDPSYLNSSVSPPELSGKRSYIVGRDGFKTTQKSGIAVFRVSLPHLEELLRCERSSCLPNDGNSLGFLLL